MNHTRNLVLYFSCVYSITSCLPFSGGINKGTDALVGHSGNATLVVHVERLLHVAVVVHRVPHFHAGAAAVGGKDTGGSQGRTGTQLGGGLQEVSPEVPVGLKAGLLPLLPREGGMVRLYPLH